jgi:hypothetical protein
MAHDENESTSKWAKDEHPVGGQQQLKKKLPQVKRIPACFQLLTRRSAFIHDVSYPPHAEGMALLGLGILCGWSDALAKDPIDQNLSYK